MTSAAIYFEDYVVGETRETQGRTITETDVVFHAGHTGDFYPHHVDDEFARTTPFGRRIAHGTMVFAIGIGLAAASRVNPVSFSYGYDRLRFVAPVFVGDTIRTRVTLAGKIDDAKRPTLGRVIERCEVVNQRGETVLVCDHLRAVERRTPLNQG
jgi:acyl dehydratase